MRAVDQNIYYRDQLTAGNEKTFQFRCELSEENQSPQVGQNAKEQRASQVRAHQVMIKFTMTSQVSILSNDTYFKVYDDILASSSEHYFNDTYRDILETSSDMSSSLYRDSLYVVIPVTIIYAAIFLTGIIGNISTCFVIARNKSMHTATNYYLFSLAVSDLLLLVSGLPAEMYMVWCKYPYIFGEGFCVLRGLASETSTNASVLIIAAFTVERYVAICHPFLSQTLSNLSRAVKLILVIWLVALLFALPQALQFGVVRHNEHPDMVMCTVKRIIVSHSFELSTFLFFVIPMCLITFLYVLIGLKLRKSNMTVPGRTQSMKNCRHHPGRSSRRVLKMLGKVRPPSSTMLKSPPFIYVQNLEIVGINNYR